ncbi:MAG: carboxypeptidase-like regulatory domain-containing protein, partial [Terriglobia bacterium]
MKGTHGKLQSTLATLLGMTLSFWLSAPLKGQVAGATLTGTVADASGAIIPGAKVSLTNVVTGVIRGATS